MNLRCLWALAIMLNKYMNLLLSEAKKIQNDIPIVALIVKNNEIIALQKNRREEENRAIAHAEILAIEEANKKLGTWRLDDCDIYVTLEPCPMCAGAILNARIKNLYYAVADKNSGGVSRFNLLNNTLNHTTNCFQIKEYEEVNKKLIQDFFKQKRISQE